MPNSDLARQFDTEDQPEWRAQLAASVERLRNWLPKRDDAYSSSEASCGVTFDY